GHGGGEPKGCPLRSKGGAQRMSYLLDNWNQVAALAGQHLVIVLVAMGLSTAFGVPLGILAARIKSLGPWILGTFGIFYLIPSLALFAILVPFTGLGL